MNVSEKEEDKSESNNDNDNNPSLLLTSPRRHTIFESTIRSEGQQQQDHSNRNLVSSVAIMQSSGAQSERPGGQAQSSPSLSRRRTGMTFLGVMKTVQKLKRLDKVTRQQSAPAVLPSSMTGGATVDENTPLFGSSTPQSQGTSWGFLPPITPTTLDGTMASPAQGGPGGSGTGTGGQYTMASILDYLKECVFGKGIVSVCLLAVPFALWSVHAQWNATYIFWLNFLVMVPLAAILGDFTEEVALHTNQTIGGLINATFGNAVEVVVALQALLAKEIRVVQSSMLGSIFSNLLLVLGGSFFFGGLKYKEQTFNTTAATASMALLALSGIALVLPTPFASYYELHDQDVLLVSRISAVFLLFMYIQLLIFQLKTHADLFEDSSDGSNDESSTNEPQENTTTTARSDVDALEETSAHDLELASIPFWAACVGLLIATLLVTVFSEYLVDSIDGFVENSGISRTFVGIILLPIVGNAVEHVTAITVARKDKMDLAMGIAVGSSTQISLLVVPLTVLVGWATDIDMNLNFPHFEIVLFVLSVFTVSIILSTPKCNWLEGSLLMTTYLLVAVGFWFERVAEYND